MPLPLETKTLNGLHEIYFLQTFQFPQCLLCSSLSVAVTDDRYYIYLSVKDT